MGSVSVVIPAYNPRADWLAEAIESAVGQDPIPLEVLVVDDGSTVPVTVGDHPLVRVIRQSNAGVAGARNRGIAEADGEFIALLDQDDYWLPGKLAAQLEVTRPGVALCTTDADVVVDGQRQPWDYGRAGGATDYATLLRGNTITASSALLDRRAIIAAGGFPDGLLGVDDWAAWLEVARRHEVSHVAAVLTCYRQHDSNVSRDHTAIWRGTLKVLWRHRSMPAVVSMVRVTKWWYAARKSASRNP